MLLNLLAWSQPEVTDSLNRIREARPIMLETNENVFRVVHIGDSHIQADWFSGRLRDLLQQHYGNAGVGLLFPYRQVRTNGPNTFSTFSKAPFQGAKIVRCRSSCNVGLSAYDAFLAKGNSIAFSLKRDTQMQFVSALYRAELNEPVLTFNSDPDTANYRLQYGENFTVASYRKQVRPEFSLQALKDFTLNGVIASNGRPGVLYYTIGANGATFGNYNSSAVFFDELRSLQPDLVIVSLGTNESVSDLSGDSLYSYLEVFYSRLSASCGHTNFLFTTPADNYRKHTAVVRKKVKGKWRRKHVVSYVNNPKAAEIREVIIGFCTRNNLMYWDLYEVMGGKGSMKSWVQAGYAAKDHIHFSKAGYEWQGELLFRALKPLIITP